MLKDWERELLRLALGCVCLGLGVALGATMMAAVAAFMPAGVSALIQSFKNILFAQLV
jgi:hypothetical protein